MRTPIHVYRQDPDNPRKAQMRELGKRAWKPVPGLVFYHASMVKAWVKIMNKQGGRDESLDHD